MTHALHLTNARLVCPAGGEREGDLLIVDGTIVSGEAPGHAERVDCRGKLLAPGIIDVGVARIDRAAARAGGVVRVAPMPDQVPVLDEPGAVQRLALIGRPDLWIHPIAAATRGLAGTDLAEMAICLSAGARAVGTGRGWIADSGVMHRVLMYARDLDVVVVTHAEDGGLAAGAVATEGETATRLGLPSAPALAEPLAIARDLMLAEETGARLHLRCVTTAAGFALVRAAKASGVRVTCGITPAYLLLSDNAMSDFRTFAHLSPPLRSGGERCAKVRKSLIALSLSSRYAGVIPHVTRTPLALAARTSANPAAVVTQRRCSRAPVSSASIRSRAIASGSASAGADGSPSRVAVSPSVATAPAASPPSSAWVTTTTSRSRAYISTRCITPESAIQPRPVPTARAPADRQIAISARSVPASPRVAAAIGWIHRSGRPISASRCTAPGSSSTGT